MRWLYQLLKALGRLMLLIDCYRLSDDIFQASGEEQSRGKERQSKPIKYITSLKTDFQPTDKVPTKIRHALNPENPHLICNS